MGNGFWIVSHFGASSPATTLKNVSTLKPTMNEIVLIHSEESMPNQPNTGVSSDEKIGSPR